MKRISCILLAAIMLFCALAPAYAAEQTLTLSSDGRTDYRIVVAANAPAAERTAADTLADYLKQITGADFPIVSDAEAARPKELTVGDVDRPAVRDMDKTGWDDDAVRLFTDGQTLCLAGGSPRGTLYAVYTFLEDRLSCRWFTHDLTVVPRQETLTVPALDYFYEPCFKLRQTYWLFSTVYSDYCAAHKLQGVMAYLPEELGGGRYEMAVSSVHTMQLFVPKTLFADHPEYFGCDESGTRSADRQPCLRNEDVFRLAVDYAKDYFSKYNAVLSVSQNDCMDFCQCDACRAFNAAHGNTNAAALLDFVNRVAVEVKKDYPDAKIETLAYQGSQTPPTGMKAEDNVVIRLCGISTCTLHDLDDPSCPSNAAFCKALTGWEALTDNLYVWEYSTNFQYYYALFPNVTALQGRFRFYRDHGVDAIFDNGCGDSIVPGEFHELRVYLLLKLLWDPDTDVARHMREFCEAYYGDAAGDVIDFLLLFEQKAGGWNTKAARMCHNSCQDGGVSLTNNTALTAPDVKRLDRLLEAAAARDLTEAQAHRLEGLSLSWRFFKNADFLGEFNWYSGLTDPEAATLQLVEDMRAYGITTLSENGALSLREEAPDARMMPTFWYTDEASLSQDVLWEMRLRVFIHRLLAAVFAPWRALRQLAG